MNIILLTHFENSLKNKFVKMYVRNHTIFDLIQKKDVTTTVELHSKPKDHLKVIYKLITDVTIEFDSDGQESIDSLSIILILDDGTHLCLNEDDSLELFDEKPKEDEN